MKINGKFAMAFQRYFKINTHTCYVIEYEITRDNVIHFILVLLFLFQCKGSKVFGFNEHASDGDSFKSNSAHLQGIHHPAVTAAEYHVSKYANDEPHGMLNR